MKRNILLLFFFSSLAQLDAQILLQENFTSPFNPAANGWVLKNISAGTPTTTWTQGDGAGMFPAFNGGPDDYISAKYNSTNSQAPATINNWLITPTLNLSNGVVLEFATRTVTNPSLYPDRLEVCLSPAGSGTNVGATPTSVGTFTILLLSVNPALTTTGYPDEWTLYTTTITALSGPTVGRIGFRYYVTGGGVNGTNSDYIGLDAVKITNSVPCAGSVRDYTICAGGSATLAANNVYSPATYSWSPGFNNTAINVVTPTATTTYSLFYTENGNNCPVLTSTVTIGSELSVNVMASSDTICSGTTVTLSAMSAASTYSWVNLGATQNVTVSPVASAIYTVGVTSGSVCTGSNTISITVIGCNTVTVGISHNDDDLKALSVYPNPFTSEIIINDHEGKIEVYNTTGQMMITTKQVTGAVVINATELVSGLYILKAYNNSGELVQIMKLMKN